MYPKVCPINWTQRFWFWCLLMLVVFFRMEHTIRVHPERPRRCDSSTGDVPWRLCISWWHSMACIALYDWGVGVRRKSHRWLWSDMSCDLYEAILPRWDIGRWVLVYFWPGEPLALKILSFMSDNLYFNWITHFENFMLEIAFSRCPFNLIETKQIYCVKRGAKFVLPMFSIELYKLCSTLFI